MLYIPNIGEYLKILTDDEFKDSLVINFGKYSKSTREKLYSKLSEAQNQEKLGELRYIFITTLDDTEKYVEMMQSSSFDNSICHHNIIILNLFDPELQLIDIKHIIKSKLK